MLTSNNNFCPPTPHNGIFKNYQIFSNDPWRHEHLIIFDIVGSPSKSYKICSAGIFEQKLSNAHFPVHSTCRYERNHFSSFSFISFHIEFSIRNNQIMSANAEEVDASNALSSMERASSLCQVDCWFCFHLLQMLLEKSPLSMQKQTFKYYSSYCKYYSF